MKKTQTTITKKQENKGMRGILDLTSTLGQVLKQFDGIYGAKLPECGGLTVEGWMSAHGVHRFVTRGGTKKGYTPALVAEGWHHEMQLDHKFYVYRKVNAKVYFGDDGRSWRVFTKEEAEKIDGKPISRYMQWEVPTNGWSVNTILKGLKQSNDYDKEAEKAALSEQEWEKLEHVYIVIETVHKAADGTITEERKIVEVPKDQVEF